MTTSAVTGNARVMRGENRYGVPFEKLDIKRQAAVILDECGRDHKWGDKVTGSGTKKFRAYLTYQLIEDAQKAGYKIKNILNLDQRHVAAAVAAWKARGLAASTIQTRLSGLKWLAAAIGKRGLVLPPEHYGLDPDQLARTYVASKDKSWTQNGVEVEKVIREAGEQDQWVAMQLAMMSAFGLRVAEAILMRPRVSMNGNQLVVEEGTKGGRSRIVEICTDKQREVLEQAIELSKRTKKGALMPPGVTFGQAKRRLYYVCEKLGITKALAAVTPHGLRHEYANDRYEEISGTPSVVRGSGDVKDIEMETEARRTVSAELGHKRLAITGAYTGPSKQLSNKVKALLDEQKARRLRALQEAEDESRGKSG